MAGRSTAAPITAALIGCGDVSTVHFEALNKIPDAELAAVSDNDPARLQETSERLGVPGFADYVEMLDTVRPDVVHICAPHHQHEPMAVACLERGINVVVEKPLAHTPEAGRRIAAAAASSGAKIAVCFQNRYNSTAREARRLLESGDLGGVRGAAGTVVWERPGDYYRARPWRGLWPEAGGGLLMNQAIHTLDLLQWLVGDVNDVRGHAATHHLDDVIDVEDTAEMVLHHAGGARSVFYATVAGVGNSPVTIDITTDEATLSLRGDLTVTYADGRTDVIPERRADSGGRDYWGVSHELLISDFYRSLADSSSFWIGPHEALKTLDIINQVYRQSFPALFA